MDSIGPVLFGAIGLRAAAWSDESRILEYRSQNGSVEALKRRVELTSKKTD